MRNWRKGLLALAAAIVAGGAASSAHAAAACGDGNASGAVDASDTTALVQVINGSPGTTLCGGSGPLNCLDLDASGAINVADLVFLLQVVSGNETLLEPCTGFGPVLACGTVVTGNITSNRQFPAGCDTIINGIVIVQPNVVLTVQPGAVVKGRPVALGAPAPGSVLVIARDGKVNAPGTAVSPIVMTSERPAGTRLLGDWGGIELLGRAPVNFPGGTGDAEGLPVGLGTFGGSEPNDSSGVLRFTRVEFSGIEIAPDVEINTITLNGVGRGTTVDHIQANAGFDDCIEWFGGNVRGTHFVSTSCRDDLFDWQIGFTGAVQFGLAYQNAATAESSGRHGIEADNNEFGFNNLPRSNPSMCNLTVIGSRQQAVVSGRSGANLRRGTAGRIANSIFMDWTSGAFDLDNGETIQQGCTSPAALKTTGDILRVSNTIAYNNGTTQVVGSDSGTMPCQQEELYALWAANTGLLPALPTDLGPDPGLAITGTFPAVVDGRYFPTDGGVADGQPNCGLEPGFFVPAPYAGAFIPGGTGLDNWLDTTGGWISFAIN